MPILLQWMCSEENGMRTFPKGIKAISTDTMLAQINSLYNAFATSPRERNARGELIPLWCDDTKILLLNSQAEITQHLLVVTEVDRIPSPEEQISGTVKAFLTMGHKEDQDPSQLTIHSACGETPEFLDQVVRMLVSGGILKGLGVRSVTAEGIFREEVPIFTRYGFVVTDETSANADVVWRGGRRRGKSKSVRSKRFRKSRRHTNKQ